MGKSPSLPEMAPHFEASLSKTVVFHWSILHYYNVVEHNLFQYFSYSCRLQSFRILDLVEDAFGYLRVRFEREYEAL